MNYSSRYLVELLNILREEEEDSLQANTFVGTIAKGYKYSLLATSVVGVGMGYFLTVLIQDHTAGPLFGLIGIVSLLMLPTCFSYRCYVDKSILKAEYYILCVRIRKEVSWKDVAYKVVRRDSNGTPLSIRLYGSNKKKLISFDCTIVGFGKIVRMAKRIPILKQKA